MVKRSAFFPREHGNTIIHIPSFCMGLTHLKPRRGLLLWLDYILAAWLHGCMSPTMFWMVGPSSLMLARVCILNRDLCRLQIKTITILIMSQNRAPNLIGFLPCLVPSRQCTSHFIRFVIAESRARAAVAFIATLFLASQITTAMRSFILRNAL